MALASRSSAWQILQDHKHGASLLSRLHDLDLNLDNTGNCQSPGGCYGNGVCTSTGTIWQWQYEAGSTIVKRLSSDKLA